MESNNIELVNDIIDFIISDTPKWKERASKILFSEIFKGASIINVNDYWLDDDNYELKITYNSNCYIIFVLKDHFNKWSIRNKALNSLGI